MANFKNIDEYLVVNGSKLTDLQDTRSYNIDEIQVLSIEGNGDKWYVRATPVGGRSFIIDLPGTPFASILEAQTARELLVEDSFWGSSGYGVANEETTYEKLLEKIENNKLIPGNYYKITDYKVADPGNIDGVVIDNTKNLNIIVLAVSENTLNYQAVAVDTDTGESYNIKYQLIAGNDKFDWLPSGETFIEGSENDFGEDLTFLRDTDSDVTLNYSQLELYGWKDTKYDYILLTDTTSAGSNNKALRLGSSDTEELLELVDKTLEFKDEALSFEDYFYFLENESQVASIYADYNGEPNEIPTFITLEGLGETRALYDGSDVYNYEDTLTATDLPSLDMYEYNSAILLGSHDTEDYYGTSNYDSATLTNYYGSLQFYLDFLDYDGFSLNQSSGAGFNYDNGAMTIEHNSETYTQMNTSEISDYTIAVWEDSNNGAYITTLYETGNEDSGDWYYTEDDNMYDFEEIMRASDIEKLFDFLGGLSNAPTEQTPFTNNGDFIYSDGGNYVVAVRELNSQNQPLEIAGNEVYVVNRDNPTQNLYIIVHDSYITVIEVSAYNELISYYDEITTATISSIITYSDTLDIPINDIEVDIKDSIPTGVTGVIYEMQDKYNNRAPFDFVSINFEWGYKDATKEYVFPYNGNGYTKLTTPIFNSTKYGAGLIVNNNIRPYYDYNSLHNTIKQYINPVYFNEQTTNNTIEANSKNIVLHNISQNNTIKANSENVVVVDKLHNSEIKVNNTDYTLIYEVVAYVDNPKVIESYNNTDVYLEVKDEDNNIVRYKKALDDNSWTVEPRLVDSFDVGDTNNTKDIPSIKAIIAYIDSKL